MVDGIKDMIKNMGKKHEMSAFSDFSVTYRILFVVVVLDRCGTPLFSMLNINFKILNIKEEN